MRTSGMTLGYRIVETMQSCLLGPAGTAVRGHEFHYSLLESKGELTYACRLADAAGQPVGHDGLMIGNTLALYSHQHFRSCPEMVTNLLRAARQAKTIRQAVRKA